MYNVSYEKTLENLFSKEKVMSVLKCESCGAKLQIIDGKSTIVCEYCGCETIIQNDDKNNSDGKMSKDDKNKFLSKLPNILEYVEKYKH